MKKTMCFFASSLVFFNMATFTKHNILQYESYFFIFRVFPFFSKKTSKNVLQNRHHIFPSKITQKSSPGTRFGTQNGPELTSGRSKNRKMCQKSRFWTQQVFEGFLRSETSLIQTIGRAARNVDGKVILYADKETKSIKKAIAETDRRRNIQLAYNLSLIHI